MPIKGLTDLVKKAPLDLRPNGRPVRLGRLQKGRREGFGKNIKLYDEDHFVFVPYGDAPDKLEVLFQHAYGEEPKEIPDARIPVSLAGNFDIEDCAWLVASKHTKNGSTFLARSDGKNILQARNPETGKVSFHREGEMLHADHTKTDRGGKECFVYGKKAYPWQQVMQVDLILPDFNRYVYEAGVAGAGVVTLTTHSTYDIAQLIQEYYGIIDAVVSLFSNPMSGDQERIANYLPLRNIPLRLFRSEDPVTTPDWRDNGDPGDRLNSTRSLVHWQLAPDFARSMQKALDQRTQQTLALVANMPLLQSRQKSIDEMNDELFGPEPKPLEQLPAETGGYSGGPDWDEVEEGIFEEADEEAIEEAKEVVAEELDSRIVDVRASLEEQSLQTVGAVAKALISLDVFTDVSSFLEAVPDFPKWPEGKKVTVSQTLSDEGTLALFDFFTAGEEE